MLRLNFKTVAIAPLFFLAIFLFLFQFPQVSAFDCSTCAPGNCYCSISECPTGSLDVYSTQCSGIPVKEFTFANNTFNWTQANANNYYFQVFCDSGAISNCTNADLTSFSNITTTTTTSATSNSSTTTTVTRVTCPSIYDCCVGDPNYINKYCSPGYVCNNYQCVSQFPTTTLITSQTPTTIAEGGSEGGTGGGNQINYSLIGIVAVVIIAGVFIFFVLKGRTHKNNQEDKWGELYKKYGRQK